MSAPVAAPIVTVPPASPARFYYGWVHVLLAAIAMTATLPGRTYGIGLITEKLTHDPTLAVTEALLSRLNFWAILIGSASCIPVGRLIDRYGTRPLLTAVSLGLGASVLAMSGASTLAMFFVTLVLIRGLGQGALSVVSMALVAKWFTRRLGQAMAWLTVLLSIGFIGSIVGTGKVVTALGWRSAWAGMGWMLILGLAPLAWLLARNTPESIGLPVEGEPAPGKRPLMDVPLTAALRSPAFWVFTLAMSMFNMAFSAITMFNESLLKEHGLTGKLTVTVMAVLVFTGLPANLFAGWLSLRWSMGRLLTVGMIALALSLLSFPWVTTPARAMLYGAGLGISGGFVTVVFFAVFGSAFGRASFGSIQSVAQVISVLASASGPLLLTEFRSRQGSTDPLFFLIAALSIFFAVACGLVRLPDRHEGPAEGTGSCPT